MVRATVDVVIAARNEARYIAKALDALSVQSYDSSLISIYVAVDLGTTDDTAEIAARHGAKVIHATNSGAASVRNAAIRAGSGDFVLFMDAHCIPERACIEEHLHAFNRPEIGASQGTFSYICADEEVAGFIPYTPFASDAILKAYTLDAQNSPYPWVVTGNAMYRREALVVAGLFDESFAFCEDAELSWRLVLNGFLLAHAPLARVEHIDSADRKTFLRRQFNYGRGTAQLAKAYGFSGENKAAKGLAQKPYNQRLLRRLYEWGLGWEERNGQSVQNAEQKSGTPLSEFRKPFFWTRNQTIALSPCIVYWYVGDVKTAIVHIASKFRILLEGSANAVFRQVVTGGTLTDTISYLKTFYDVSEITVKDDINDLVTDLVRENILVID